MYAAGRGGGTGEVHKNVATCVSQKKERGLDFLEPEMQAGVSYPM